MHESEFHFFCGTKLQLKYGNYILFSSLFLAAKIDTRSSSGIPRIWENTNNINLKTIALTLHKNLILNQYGTKLKLKLYHINQEKKFSVILNYGCKKKKKKKDYLDNSLLIF